MTPFYRQILLLAQETIQEWQEDRAASVAAALAYYAIFSLSPLLIILALLIGLVLGQDASDTTLVEDLETAVGEEGANTFRDMMENQNQSSSSITGSIIWFGVIIWGASGLFAQLQDALNRIWEVKPKPERSMIAFMETRLLSFVVVITAAVLLIVTLVINTALNTAIRQGLRIADFALVIRPLQLIVTMSMLTVLFAIIFKVLPDVVISYRDVMVGAAFTAFLFMLGQFAVGFYLASMDVGSVFGAAGSLTVILVWIYYSAQILLFGAEFTEVWARHHGAAIVPTAGAMWLNEAQARREAEAALAKKAQP